MPTPSHGGAGTSDINGLIDPTDCARCGLQKGEGLRCNNAGIVLQCGYSTSAAHSAVELRTDLAPSGGDVPRAALMEVTLEMPRKGSLLVGSRKS